MFKLGQKKRTVKNKSSYLGRLKASTKGKAILVILSVSFTVFFGVFLNDCVINPISDLIHENDIKIIAVSTINIYRDEEYHSYNIEGEFQHIFGNEPYFRDGPETGTYILDIKLPPFPERDIKFDMLGGYSESKNVEQTIFIYSEGSKIEDFSLKIYYGYPILEVEGEGSKLFTGNGIIINKPEILPGSIESLEDKNFPITTVSLDTNDSINLSKIIENVEVKYYRKGIVYSYWNEIPNDNFIHWGMVGTNFDPPFEVFSVFFEG